SMATSVRPTVVKGRSSPSTIFGYPPPTGDDGTGRSRTVGHRPARSGLGGEPAHHRKQVVGEQLLEEHRGHPVLSVQHDGGGHHRPRHPLEGEQRLAR